MMGINRLVCSPARRDPTRGSVAVAEQAEPGALSMISQSWVGNSLPCAIRRNLGGSAISGNWAATARARFVSV